MPAIGHFYLALTQKEKTENLRSLVIKKENDPARTRCLRSDEGGDREPNLTFIKKNDPARTRTENLTLKRRLLCRLSYRTISCGLLYHRLNKKLCGRRVSCPKGSPERTRTSNLAVNSRPLCRLSYQGRRKLL